MAGVNDLDFFDKYLMLLFTKISPSANNCLGCMFWDADKFGIKQKDLGSPKYGRQQVHYPDGSSSGIHAHRLMYICTKQHFLPRVPGIIDVSHLCHNSLCIRFDHLSLEPPVINSNRKVCKRRKNCHGHGQYKDCLFQGEFYNVDLPHPPILVCNFFFFLNVFSDINSIKI